MEYVLINARMRESDGFTISGGVPSTELMRRAGVALADEVAAVAGTKEGREILVVCGTGNNGGDGYVCAEELRKRGFDVSVFALSGKLSFDCEREKNVYKGRYFEHIRGSIIVDCIFGTGLAREISGEIAKVIDEINSSGAFVISADIPSGLSDCGKPLGRAVKADRTVAIAEFKMGHFLNDGLDFCGKLVKKDIGITLPEEVKNTGAVVYGDEDLKRFFPNRRRNTHKGTYGTANIIAGSEKYIGAAALAAGAALKSGCGLVKLTTEDRVKFALAAKYPQVIFTDGFDLTATAIAIGMGSGVSEAFYKKSVYLLENYNGTLVIDADGLNSLSKYGADILKNRKCEVVLTPHIKEFSRLAKISVEEITADPIGRAKAFAKEYGVTLVLKSATTVITDGERTVLNVRGTTALAKGGSGDMLAGYLCGTLARGLSAFDAAVVAPYVLGVSAEIVSGERTDFCATAYDIIKNLHTAVKRLTCKN